MDKYSNKTIFIIFLTWLYSEELINNHYLNNKRAIHTPKTQYGTVVYTFPIFPSEYKL